MSRLKKCVNLGDGRVAGVLAYTLRDRDKRVDLARDNCAAD